MRRNTSKSESISSKVRYPSSESSSCREPFPVSGRWKEKAIDANTVVGEQFGTIGKAFDKRVNDQ
jgi:hypothetical protein